MQKLSGQECWNRSGRAWSGEDIQINSNLVDTFIVDEKWQPKEIFDSKTHKFNFLSGSMDFGDIWYGLSWDDINNKP